MGCYYTKYVDDVNIERKETLHAKVKIDHCHGCFACWTKTPGKCAIKDDMERFIEQYIKADLIVWSFPLYYFGMPSKIKAFLDRMLPTNLPYMDLNEDGTSGHAPRYDLSHQRFVLISTCGFYATKNNYDALIRQFEILYGDNLIKIICTEGELLSVPQLEGRISEYLAYAKQAGEEFSQRGSIELDTQEKLSELLFPPDVFVEMADATAYYSSDDYNGDEAFINPLFIKTNKILTTAWGVLYLIVAAYSYFLMGSILSSYTGLINSLAPVLMGLFTVWFAKWYPARIARG